MMSDFDGKMISTVVKTELEEPRAIAIHPEQGWIFWSDWGQEPKIEKAGMDGSHRTTIIKDSVHWPNGITIDLALNRIFWVDAKLNIVGSANLDGSDSRIVLYSREKLRHPFSISVFEDMIYWSDWHHNTIFAANKFNGSSVRTVTPHMRQIPMVVHVYHPFRYMLL